MLHRALRSRVGCAARARGLILPLRALGRSAGRRRAQRRRRALAAAALLVLAASAAWGVLWAAGGRLWRSPSPAATVGTTASSPAALASPPAGAGALASSPALAASGGPGVTAVLEPATPKAPAIRRALAWAGGRRGEVAVALVDTGGALRGYRVHRTFQAASLAKAVLLVAYLRAQPTRHAELDLAATAMIQKSDNASADAVFREVGARGIQRVARLAGMADYEQGGGWIDTRLSAADAARLFSGLWGHVPRSRRAFARRLLSGVTPVQRWGIPAAAGPEGWTAYFKGGWLGLDNRLMVQAARLEKGHKAWALAVMTDENPSRSYGWDTQKGVAGLLIGAEPTPGYLAVVLEP